MKNINLLYGVIGLALGIAITSLVCWNNHHKDTPMQASMVGMHQMADGSMMSNGGTDMSSMMNDMTAGLQGKTGDAFDKEFLAEMIVHHEGAVAMAKQVLATSKRPELIKLANDIISAQTSEITMMKAWQKAWFNQ